MTTSTNTTRMTAAIAPNFTQRGIPGYVAAPLLRELAPDSSAGRADDGDSLTAFPSLDPTLSRHYVYVQYSVSHKWASRILA